MKNLVGFKNPKTGEIKFVKCGFSWTIFFFAGFFGLPLFMRKLNAWGAIMAALYALGLILPPALIPGIIVQIYLAFSGNRLTAIDLLERDWQVLEPNSELIKLALRQWGLSVSETAVNPENLVSKNVEAPTVTAVTKPSSGTPILPVVLITIVCVIGLLMLLGRNSKTIADNSSNVETVGASESTKPESQWTIRKEKDKLSDTVSIKAYRIFSVDNGRIEATLECKKLLMNQVDALQLELNYFAQGDNGNGNNPDSSFEHETKINEVWGYGRQAWQDSRVPLEVITVEYRFDSEPTEQMQIQSKYRNQVVMNFTDSFGGYIQRFSTSNLLRVRLPLIHGNRADIEIQTSDLHDVIASCASMTKSETNVDASSPSSQVNNRQHLRNPDGSIYVSTAEKVMREANERSTQTKTPSMFGGYYEDKPVIDTAGDMIREARERSARTNSSVQAVPSINCNSPRLTTVELIVCSSPNLIKADALLNGTYQQLVQSLDNSSLKSLKKDQKQWLANRSIECGVKMGDIDEQESSRLLMCLQGLYDHRVSELQSRLQ